LIETLPLRSGATLRYPLTATQKGILMDSLVASEKGVNIEQIIWQFDQVPDLERLKQAWQSALESFDALRLRLRWPESEEPWQEIADSVRMPFRVIDWSTVTTGQSVNVKRILAEDRRLGFDLFQVPLCRVTVVSIGRFRALCLWTIHHAIIDGGSYATVLEHVRSQLEQPARVLRPVAQFADFLSWTQQQQFHSGTGFYKELLAGIDEPTLLPLQIDNTVVAHGTCAACLAKVPADITQKLLERAREAGASTNTIVQLAWGIVLSRYACASDVLFGATWSGRPNTVEHANDIVGPFINTLPVRVQFLPDQTVREALIALREQHLASRPFHHTPIHLIKAASGLSRVAHLFGTIVVFEYQRFHSILGARDVRWNRDYLASYSQPNYPLTLAVSGNGAELDLELDYDIALYDRTRAAQLIAEYLRVLEQMAQSLDQPIVKVRLQDDATYIGLTATEAAREIVAQRPCPVFTILDGATRRGDSVAIEADDGGTLS